MLDIAPRIVVGVPGMWKTRQEMVDSVTAAGADWVFEGEGLRLGTDGPQFGLDVVGYDGRLAADFSVSGKRSLSPEELEAVRRHTQTVYVQGEGGAPERARAMLHVVTGLVKGGGLGVKVETAGVAHSPANWLALDAAPEVVALYHAFVTMVAAENVYYSRGMHNLGLPDATVPRSLPPRDAARTLEGFLLYLLYENPELSDSHTFSLGAGSPRFKLQENPCTMFPKEHPYYNPYGIWILH